MKKRVLVLIALVLSVILISVPPVGAQATDNGLLSVVSTQWDYMVPGAEDSFTNEEVTGIRKWEAALQNNTGVAVCGVSLSLASTLKFDQVEPEPVVSPGTYEWLFGEVLQGSRASAKVGFLSPDPFPIDFEPGLDASRSATPTEFSPPGTHTQYLTIAVTPREDKEQGYFDVLVYADGNPWVNPVITDWSGPGDPLVDDEHVLLIRNDEFVVGEDYDYSVTIEVTPTVAEVKFMPLVRVTLSNYEPWNSAPSGSCFSHLPSEEGTWTWCAEGDYSWNWVEFLGKSVNFPWYSTPNVEIDIKPLSSSNTILLWRYGLIAVAVLSTEDFDTTSEVNRSSLTFGRTGDEESFARCLKYNFDVNRDGLKDLVCVFKTRLTGFQAGDTMGILKGKTVHGIPIEGRDLVTVIELPWIL